VENAKHFDGMGSDAIKQDVALDDDASQTGSNFLARTPNTRQLAELGTPLVNSGGESFRGGRTVLVEVIENISEIALRALGSQNGKHYGYFRV